MKEKIVSYVISVDQDIVEHEQLTTDLLEGWKVRQLNTSYYGVQGCIIVTVILYKDESTQVSSQIF